MNEYELLTEFQNNNAGFSRWAFASRKNKDYFLKEFVNPIYPDEDSLSLSLREQRIKDCEKFESQKVKLYNSINEISDGNLVRIYEFFRFDSHYYISTEKINNPLSLSEIAKTSFEDRLFLCKYLSYSVMKLHRKGIVHADIKDTNILAKKTKTGRTIAKVIDFDCAFFENDPPVIEDELGGDLVYLAPESCMFICGEQIKLNSKIDVFALGLLFHQYLTGELPYFNKEEYEYAHESVLDDHELAVSATIPENIRAILVRMLLKEAEQRCTLSDVFNAFALALPKDSSIHAAVCDTDEENAVEKKGYSEDQKKHSQWFQAAGDL